MREFGVIPILSSPKLTIYRHSTSNFISLFENGNYLQLTQKDNYCSTDVTDVVRVLFGVPTGTVYHQNEILQDRVLINQHQSNVHDCASTVNF
jgi:hypothetical protein